MGERLRTQSDNNDNNDIPNKAPCIYPLHNEMPPIPPDNSCWCSRRKRESTNKKKTRYTRQMRGKETRIACCRHLRIEVCYAALVSKRVAHLQDHTHRSCVLPFASLDPAGWQCGAFGADGGRCTALDLLVIRKDCPTVSSRGFFFQITVYQKLKPLRKLFFRWLITIFGSKDPDILRFCHFCYVLRTETASDDANL